jgi:hypothetical protein
VGLFFEAGTRATQKGRSWAGRKNHAAEAESEVEEPETGRTVERHMSSLANGVGASLRDHPRHQWSGRHVRDQAPETGSVNSMSWPVYGFPSGSPPQTTTAPDPPASTSVSSVQGPLLGAVFCFEGAGYRVLGSVEAPEAFLGSHSGLPTFIAPLQSIALPWMGQKIMTWLVLSGLQSAPEKT